MCFECDELDDKWPPVIEFSLWFLVTTINVMNHFGVFRSVDTHVFHATDPLYCNATHVSILKKTYNKSLTLDQSPNADPIDSDILSGYDKMRQYMDVPIINQMVTDKTFTNHSLIPIVYRYVCVDKSMEEHFTEGHVFKQLFLKSPLDQWHRLMWFRRVYLGVCFLGLAFLISHTAMLLPNLIKTYKYSAAVVLKENEGFYYQNILLLHSVFLLAETFFYDMPIGCITMEFLALIWENHDTTLTDDQKMTASRSVMALSLVGLAFSALYKGMMPIFIWLGNPFCCPCIPLRLVTVFPGGLLATVMTFAPIMAVASKRLVPVAPAEYMQAEIGDMADTFVSVGVICWVLFFITVFIIYGFWHQCCRPGADCSFFCP